MIIGYLKKKTIWRKNFVIRKINICFLKVCIVSTIKKKTLWLVSAKMVKILIWKCAGDCEPSLKIQKKYYLFFSCLVAVFLYGFSCAGLSSIELKLPDKGKTIDFFFFNIPKITNAPNNIVSSSQSHLTS